MDWKLQNNHEKRRKNRTKQFYRNLILNWKPRKTSEEQTGMSILSYKRE